MKAIVVTRAGGPEVLEYRDWQNPKAESGKVVVRIEAAGVNFADIAGASGTYPGTPAPPFVAGREFAGVVENTGERVMGYAQHGAFAERILAGRELLWPQPAGWTSQQSAAFPVNYFTAYFAYWKAGLLEGKRPAGRAPRVLIHAAAGGVGTAAVEIGKILGVEMYGTSSSDEKLAKVQQLGLARGINYKREDYEAKIAELTNKEGVDSVFEMLGGEHVEKSVRCLGFLGSVITYGSATGQPAHLNPRLLFPNQVSVHGLWLTPLSAHRDIMEPAWKQLSGWITEGRLNPVVGHSLPMPRATDAYRLLAGRNNYGKVVLTN